jgi:Zn-finger protein
MEAKITRTDSKRVTIELTIELEDEMLDMEEAIQQGVNQAGMLATQYALSKFDTDGAPITVEKKKYTSKGQLSKTYQCPFGEFELCRHVYQSNEGGSTYCPLDNDARILVFSTPKFAKMVSQKYSQIGSLHVQRDLKENHSRSISRTYIQDISSAVGEVASTRSWRYTTGISSSEVFSIGISQDGTCMFIRDDGWRQAMVGSISLYNEEGERIHTSYLAQAPEYGKEKFYSDFTKEIMLIKKTYKNKIYVGVADGAAENWKFLEPYVDVQVLDFFHATEYLSKVSKAAFKRKDDGKKWLKQSCHTLKHEDGGAEMLLKEMKELINKKISQEKKTEINSSITYFTNHLEQMKYSRYLASKMPIGSGVIEAACKVIIKQRMCNSGMKWTDNGAKNVLVLRCFNETDGKWSQFWNKISKMGYLH